MEIVRVPPGIRFKCIGKERLTRGRLYCVSSASLLPWVSQSLAVLPRLMRLPAYASCLYRLVRGDTRRGRLKDGTTAKRVSVDELNALIWGAGCVVVTRQPALWEIDEAAGAVQRNG